MTAGDDTVLLRMTDASTAKVQLREGDEVPGLFGSKIKTFSVLSPGGTDASVIFLAETSGGENKLALWVVDSTGTLRRLLRTNDALTVGGSPITGLTLLTAVPGAFGATRSYNATGSIALLAKTQALLRVDIP